MADTSRIEELRRRVQRDPASIAFAQLAEEYRRAGRYQDAIETCESGLAHHPGYLSARVTLGRSLLEVGELEAAQLELRHVLRAAPENLAALRGLAEIHHRRGELSEALSHYRMALEFARTDPELLQLVDQIEKELEPRVAAAVVVDGLSFEEVKDTFLNLSLPERAEAGGDGELFWPPSDEDERPAGADHHEELIVAAESADAGVGDEPAGATAEHPADAGCHEEADPVLVGVNEGVDAVVAGLHEEPLVAAAELTDPGVGDEPAVATAEHPAEAGCHEEAEPVVVGVNEGVDPVVAGLHEEPLGAAAESTDPGADDEPAVATAEHPAEAGCHDEADPVVVGLNEEVGPVAAWVHEGVDPVVAGLHEEPLVAAEESVDAGVGEEPAVATAEHPAEAGCHEGVGPVVAWGHEGVDPAVAESHVGVDPVDAGLHEEPLVAAEPSTDAQAGSEPAVATEERPAEAARQVEPPLDEEVVFEPRPEAPAAVVEHEPAGAALPDLPLAAASWTETEPLGGSTPAPRPASADRLVAAAPAIDSLQRWLDAVLADRQRRS